MSFHFTEAALEQSIINLLENQGYKHVLGETIERDPHDILLKDDLRAYCSLATPRTASPRLKLRP